MIDSTGLGSPLKPLTGLVRTARPGTYPPAGSNQGRPVRTRFRCVPASTRTYQPRGRTSCQRYAPGDALFRRSPADCVPIREQPPGHWSRVWSHGMHVRPSIPQLRCRGAACEGDADASARVDSCSSLATQRTLISARTDVLVARASRCCCSWCCMLPSARSSTSGVSPRGGSTAVPAS